MPNIILSEDIYNRMMEAVKYVEATRRGSAKDQPPAPQPTPPSSPEIFVKITGPQDEDFLPEDTDLGTKFYPAVRTEKIVLSDYQESIHGPLSEYWRDWDGEDDEEYRVFALNGGDLSENQRYKGTIVDAADGKYPVLAVSDPGGGSGTPSLGFYQKYGWLNVTLTAGAAASNVLTLPSSIADPTPPAGIYVVTFKVVTSTTDVSGYSIPKVYGHPSVSGTGCVLQGPGLTGGSVFTVLDATFIAGGTGTRIAGSSTLLATCPNPPTFRLGVSQNANSGLGVTTTQADECAIQALKIG